MGRVDLTDIIIENGTKLKNKILYGNLYGNFFSFNIFEHCNFYALNLTNVKFSKCIFKNCTFHKVIFYKCYIRHCRFIGCKFEEAIRITKTKLVDNSFEFVKTNCNIFDENLNRIIS